MIFNENDISQENKNNIIINEEIITNEDYSRKYNTLQDFCKVFTSVEYAMYWYKYNNVKWPEHKQGEDPNNRPFSWPDDILKTKIGVCWDHAIFFYYFCKFHNIPARMYRYAIYAEPFLVNQYWCMGHMVCLCKLESGYYVCNYGTKAESNLYGPFKSFYECSKNYASWYRNHVITIIRNDKYDNQNIKDFTDTYYAYTDNKDLKLYDKYYNNHNISQLEFDKMLTSTKLKYDHKSIQRNIIDEIANTVLYHAKSLWTKFFD